MIVDLFRKTPLRLRLIIKTVLLVTVMFVACLDIYLRAQVINSSVRKVDFFYAQSLKLDAINQTAEDIVFTYMKSFAGTFDPPVAHLKVMLNELDQAISAQDFFPAAEAQALHENIVQTQNILAEVNGYIAGGQRKEAHKAFYDCYLTIIDIHDILHNRNNLMDREFYDFREKSRPKVIGNPYRQLVVLMICLTFVLTLGLSLLMDVVWPLRAVADRMILASKDTRHAQKYIENNIRCDELGHMQRALNTLLIEVEDNIKRSLQAETLAYQRLAAIQSAQAEREKLEKQFSEVHRREVVGRLTGGIAHDFNNMLTIIGGHLDMAVQSMASDPEATQHIQTARRAVIRGAELIQRLMAFSRSQSLNPQIVNLNTIIPESTMMMIRAIGEHVEIIFDLAENLDLTRIDIAQFESALINMAINARDVMPDGGYIRIKTKNVYLKGDEFEQAHDGPITPGHYVLVEVSDTGSGIASDIIGKIFDPFFTTKEVGVGSGLGLSMVYGFVKQSNGHIAVESNVGVGTAMRLYFPRADMAELAQHAGSKVIAESVMPDAWDDRVFTGDERILIVEDEEEILKLNRNILKRCGYTIFEARNGAEALALVQQEKEIDLLVTDIMMPGGMNGFDLAGEIEMQIPGIKTLFISGYAAGHLINTGEIPAGVNMLPKPYSSAQLVERVRQTLDEGKTAKS